MSRVLVLGNATVDVILRVERLPRPGETLLSESTLRCAGGKGLNQAVAAARTGAVATLVAPVGAGDGDSDSWPGRSVTRLGLTLSWQVADVPTDMSSIWVSGDGENMIVSTALAAHSLSPADARRICAGLTTGDLLLMQGNLRADTTRAAAEIAHAMGARTVLNTAPIAWDMRPVIGLFDIVIGNEGEAAMLADGADFWPTLSAAGVAQAVVTLGSAGARLYGPNAAIAAPLTKAIDTAGAGDVMVGTLVGLLAQGWCLADAAGKAVAAASLSVTRAGTLPSFPSRGELRQLFAGS